MSTLHAQRARTRASLWAERLVEAAAPSLAMLCGLVGIAWLGFAGWVPPWLDATVVGFWLSAAVLLAAWRLSRVQAPTPLEIDRRLEHGPAALHRPLATLADEPATGSASVWRAHQDRARAEAAFLRAPPPRLAAPYRTGMIGLVLALAGSFAVSGGDASARLGAALLPDLRERASALQIRAWIVPPAATGLAPVYLQAATTTVVPANSTLTVSVTGGSVRPQLRYGTLQRRFDRLDTHVFQVRVTLRPSPPMAAGVGSPGMLTVQRGGSRLAQWGLKVTADAPPSVILAGPQAVRDNRLVLPWTATDDFGLASVTAEIRRAGDTRAPPFALTIKMDGMPQAARGSGLPDLTAHPWAGLPVTVRYVARDGGGQTGASASIAAVLPERVFANRLARALIAVRRDLAANTEAAAAAAAALDRLTPEASATLPSGAWLNLRAIAAMLAQSPTPVEPDANTVAEALDRIWTLAVTIEDGGVGAARQRLAAARRALAEALANPAPLHLDALSTEMQRALQQYLRALSQHDAAQSRPADGKDTAASAGKPVDPAQLQRMAQDLADAAKAGRLADAQARLDRLGAMLDRLRPDKTPPAQVQKAQTVGRPDPAVEALVKGQTTLRQHSDQRLADDGDPRASGTPGRDPDEAPGQPDSGAQRKADAGTQSVLRRQLGALADRVGAQTGRVPDGLAQADNAMRQAQAALRAGDDAAARAAQQRALDGLRAGGDQMAQQQGNGPGGASPGQAKADTSGKGHTPSDPFGRSAEEGGQSIDDSDQGMPVAADAASSRALRDELRRRAAERTRPQQELDYIDRLLKPD